VSQSLKRSVVELDYRTEESHQSIKKTHARTSDHIWLSSMLQGRSLLNDPPSQFSSLTYIPSVLQHMESIWCWTKSSPTQRSKQSGNYFVLWFYIWTISPESDYSPSFRSNQVFYIHVCQEHMKLVETQD